MKTVFFRLVLLINGLSLALCGIAFVDFLLHPLAGEPIFHSPLFRAVVVLVLVPFTLLVAFLIIRRVPGNIVGRLLVMYCGTIAYWSIRPDIGWVLFGMYAAYDIVFGWLGLFLMLLHFPSGEIYPRRAAPWLYALLGLLFPMACLVVASQAYFQVPDPIPNPFFVPVLERYAGVINGVGILLISIFLGQVMITPLLRYRKGSSIERQQIKWLTLFAGFIVIYSLLFLIAYPLLTGGLMMFAGADLSGLIFLLVAGLFPPLAIGIGVLRYRLWDIDLIIRRTLVYSLLTVTLALIYFGSVVVMQALFTVLSGAQSPVANIISTLTIAALFTPIRRRIQAFIDRSFYRQQYNADLVLTRFGSTLRERVELDQLTNLILGVVESTVQPANASLWLGKARAPSREPQRPENFSQKSMPSK